MASDPHSADWLLRASRDFWWNPDFLDLMGRRWDLRRVRRVLDAGCGLGHWGQLLCRVLPRRARITGVDREPKWVEGARSRARRLGLSRRSTYLTARVESLPFPDGAFDLVTCQTLLIHVREPRRVLREMHRVLAPGGLMIAAEPNNRASALLRASDGSRESLSSTVQDVKDVLIAERGKRRRGKGDNSVGDLVPGLMHALGLTDVRVFLSDKAVPMLAPYSSPEQRVARRELATWLRRPPDRAEALNDHLAGGGTQASFARFWGRGLANGRRALESMRAGGYASAGASVMYLVTGRKRRHRVLAASAGREGHARRPPKPRGETPRHA